MEKSQDLFKQKFNPAIILLYLGVSMVSFAFFILFAFTWDNYSDGFKLFIIGGSNFFFLLIALLLKPLKRVEDASRTFYLLSVIILHISSLALWQFYVKGAFVLLSFEWYWVVASVLITISAYGLNHLFRSGVVKVLLYLTIHSSVLALGFAIFEHSIYAFAFISAVLGLSLLGDKLYNNVPRKFTIITSALICLILPGIIFQIADSRFLIESIPQKLLLLSGLFAPMLVFTRKQKSNDSIDLAIVSGSIGLIATLLPIVLFGRIVPFSSLVSLSITSSLIGIGLLLFKLVLPHKKILEPIRLPAVIFTDLFLFVSLINLSEIERANPYYLLIAWVSLLIPFILTGAHRYIFNSYLRTNIAFPHVLSELRWLIYGIGVLVTMYLSIDKYLDNVPSMLTATGVAMLVVTFGAFNIAQASRLDLSKNEVLLSRLTNIILSSLSLVLYPALVSDVTFKEFTVLLLAVNILLIFVYRNKLFSLTMFYSLLLVLAAYIKDLDSLYIATIIAITGLSVITTQLSLRFKWMSFFDSKFIDINYVLIALAILWMTAQNTFSDFYFIEIDSIKSLGILTCGLMVIYSYQTFVSTIRRELKYATPVILIVLAWSIGTYFVYDIQVFALPVAVYLLYLAYEFGRAQFKGASSLVNPVILSGFVVAIFTYVVQVIRYINDPAQIVYGLIGIFISLALIALGLRHRILYFTVVSMTSIALILIILLWEILLSIPWWAYIALIGFTLMLIAVLLLIKFNSSTDE